MIKKCPKCKSDQIITESGNCSVCGTNVEDAANQTSQDDGDQLDIVVTEVPEDDREFVGGDKELNSKDKLDKNFKPGSKGKPEESHRQRALSYDPIGSSEPTLPPVSDSEFEQSKNFGSEGGEKEKIPEMKASEVGAGHIKKLTPEEIKAIEKNLYGKNVHLADKEKASIREKINEIGTKSSEKHPVSAPIQHKGDKTPILSETLKPVDPETAGRGRSIAYYYKNYIKLTGQHQLSRHDELTLNGRLYSLQPKRLKPTYVYAGLGVAFVLVLFLIGSWFVKDAADGRGQIAGVVLDINNRPYIKGAKIRFPDLGITVEASAQGMFSSDDIPAGAHKIEYLVDGRVIGSDHATVLDNGISMIALRPSNNTSRSNYSSRKSSKKSSSSKSATTTKKNDYTPPPQPKTEPEPTPATTVKKNEPGSIELAANVDNAKLKVDGKVLGAGNLTYSSISPGSHRYEVTADGYKKSTGTIRIESGETKKLALTLSPLSQQAKQQTYGGEDFFQSGVNALKSGKYEESIKDFTAAIQDIPSYPQAYYNRGLAYQILKDNESAFDDFIRAAEIYRIKREFNWAITSYGRAIDINSNSVPAYLGRGDLFLAKGEEIAALTDYDAVVRLDKRNYRGYFGLGQARFRQGQYKKAIEHFKDARSINKDDPELYQQLMLCYMAVNDFNQVKEAYQNFNSLASEDQKNEMLRDKRFTAAIEVAKRQ